VDRPLVEDAIAVTTNRDRIRDATLERLQVHFRDGQTVGLTWLIALFGAFNRLNEVLQMEVDV